MPDKNALDLASFAFSGIARHRRGWTTPIEIRVAAPILDRPEEYISVIECALFLSKPHAVRSNDAQHSYALAFRLLRSMLSDFSFESGTGIPFYLPRIPPEEDDWKFNHQTPDTGYGFGGDAVDSTGAVRRFYVGGSVPKPENGHTTDINYGSHQTIVETLYGSNVLDAFYNAIEWIETCLDADGLVLLDIWNMPLELPKRPKA